MWMCFINHRKSSAILKLEVINMYLQNVLLDLESLEDGWLVPTSLSTAEGAGSAESFFQLMSTGTSCVPGSLLREWPSAGSLTTQHQRPSSASFLLIWAWLWRLRCGRPSLWQDFCCLSSCLSSELCSLPETPSRLEATVQIRVEGFRPICPWLSATL